jgi:hypothetical protein
MMLYVLLEAVSIRVETPVIWLRAAAPRFVRAELELVAPVPPFATARVPARVIVPVVVIGDPVTVRPVVPPDRATDVTVPDPPAAAK